MAKTHKGRRGKASHHVDWKKIREAWESDPTATFKSLVQPGAVRQTISKRAAKEGWTRVDATAPKIQKQIRQRADEKSNDVRPVEGEVIDAQSDVPDPPGLPSPRSVDAAIEARAAIHDRHRREWNLARNRLYKALQKVDEVDFQIFKEAKISAETLSIIQAGERKAWLIEGVPTMNVRIVPLSGRDEYD